MTQPQDNPAPESFGDSRVDAAVRRLAELADRPVADHVEVFEDVHARLRDALEDAAVDPAEQPA